MKKIIFNILLLVFLFCILNVGFYYYVLFKYEIPSRKRVFDNVLGNKIPPYRTTLYNISDMYYDKREYRPVMNPDSSEQPVLIFGCSFAHGYIFDNKETISYIMSKYSKRPIINRARNGWGVQHMLYTLKEDEELFDNIKPPKYIFYVLMDSDSHFRRLYYTTFPNITQNFYYLSYVNKNGVLTERKPFLNKYYNVVIFNHIYNEFMLKKVNRDFKNNSKELFDFFILHFKTINDIIKERWGNNPKFVILTFENTKKELWAPQLQKMGIDVVDISETIGISNLYDDRLGFFEFAHPNGKLWQLFVPKLKEMYPDL